MNDSDARKGTWVRENLEPGIALKHLRLVRPAWLAGDRIVCSQQHAVARLALYTCERLHDARLKAAELIDAEPIAEVIGYFFVIYFDAREVFPLLKERREIVILFQPAQRGCRFKRRITVGRYVIQLE